MAEATEYKPHPASLMFPMLPETELAELEKDIRANGLRHPIVLFEGMVLDGRNRLLACRRGGIEPQFITPPDIQPFTYVVSANLRRRHLTTSQCGAISVEIEPQLRAEAKERQLAAGARGIEGGRGHKKETLAQDPAQGFNPAETRDRTRDEVAKIMGVSHYTVDNARAVKNADPVLFERVKRGEVSVEAAYREVTNGKAPKPTKPRALAPIRTKRQQILDGSAKQRMIEGLSGAAGLCQGLMSLKISGIRARCTAEELRTWATSARESARQLRAFAVLLLPAREK